MTRAICGIGTALAAAMWLSAGGCSGSNPYAFASPPTVPQPGEFRGETRSQKPVIVIGEFANPPVSSLHWGDVGRGVSDALARTMFNDGRFDVWLRPELSRQVESVLRGSPARRDEELGRIQQENPDVDFVLAGRVTDFIHTRDLPRDLARQGLFGSKQQAFVAVQMDMVDLATRRIISITHLYGTAPADQRSAAESYKGLRVSSYLFWSTPLGKATRTLIERTVEHLAALVPGPSQDLRITGIVDWRQVTIGGGRGQGLVSGERYFLLVNRGVDQTSEPVLDADTRQPLQVRIIEVDGSTATAWLLGRLPADVDPRDISLARALPGSSRAAAVIKAAPSAQATAGVTAK